MKPASAIHGIIFDMDGVLIDSLPCHRAAFEQVFGRFNIHDFDYSAYAGWRTTEVVEEVLKRAGLTASPESIEAAAREKSRLARECLAASKPLMQGCSGILAELSGRYRLALATSGSRASLDAFWDLAGCRKLFQAALCGEDVSHAKPHPEIYRRSIQQLAMDSSGCIVVEDAVAGIEAARAAGASAVGITGTCPEDRLRRAGAVGVIASLAELPALLATL